MSVMSLFITYFRKVCFMAKLHIKPNLLDLLFCIFMNQEKKKIKKKNQQPIFPFRIMKYKLSRLRTSRISTLSVRLSASSAEFSFVKARYCNTRITVCYCLGEARRELNQGQNKELNNGSVEVWMIHRAQSRQSAGFPWKYMREVRSANKYKLCTPIKVQLLTVPTVPIFWLTKKHLRVK